MRASTSPYFVLAQQPGFMQIIYGPPFIFSFCMFRPQCEQRTRPARALFTVPSCLDGRYRPAMIS